MSIAVDHRQEIAKPPASQGLQSDRLTTATDRLRDGCRPHCTLRCRVGGEYESQWFFELRDDRGSVFLAAEDMEQGLRGEELELLTVIRGLESLDQPSHVTLCGASRYVRQGLHYGLREWRRSDWRWEWFGQMVPVRHASLWRRLDHALRFHRLECRHWRIDGPHNGLRPTEAPAAGAGRDWGVRVGCSGRLEYDLPARFHAWLRRVFARLAALVRPLAGHGQGLEGRLPNIA